MEASGGPDGGSDVSYESVASEGGYEPASERGRDPLPRIISSSHCVEVFRRVRWADGAFCCHAHPAGEGGRSGKAPARRGDPQRRAHDPLAGLPPRLLRFDGAIEAWLEEMPLPRDPHHAPRPYATLNDAAARQTPSRTDLTVLRAGNCRATLWYFTLEFLQQLWPFFLQPDGCGLNMWEKALLDRKCTIQSTHVEVGRMHYPLAKNGKARGVWLKDLFSAMQASKWTPDGEARMLLVNRRMSHASMSIGDAVQIGSELFVAGLTGFVAIKEGERLLPPQSELLEPDDEVFEMPASGKGLEKYEDGAGGGARIDQDGGRKGGRRGKGRGGGRGKGRGKGQELGDGARMKEAANEQRTKELGLCDRADRRKLRAQLQARREQLQGGR